MHLLYLPVCEVYLKKVQKTQQCLLLALVEISAAAAKSLQSCPTRLCEISDHALKFKVFFPFKKTLFFRAILHLQQN